MKKFERVDDETRAVIDQVREDYHPDLDGLGIGALFVSDGDKATLTHKGYPAAALIRKVPPWARALAGLDVAMVIDRFTWTKLDETQRQALVDHELQHVCAEDTKDGWKISLRLHDFVVGGFYEVARRWGSAALEVQELHRQLVDDERGQLMLPGLDITSSETGEVLAGLMQGGDDD